MTNQAKVNQVRPELPVIEEELTAVRIIQTAKRTETYRKLVLYPSISGSLSVSMDVHVYIYSPVVAHSVKGTGKLWHISAAEQTAFLVKHIIKHGSITEDRVGYILPWSATGVAIYTLGIVKVGQKKVSTDYHAQILHVHKINNIIQV